MMFRMSSYMESCLRACLKITLTLTKYMFAGDSVIFLPEQYKYLAMFKFSLQALVKSEKNVGKKTRL